MLEFVNVSGSSGGKDDQTRRKVRSQAMRDFRRRQREEREATDTPAKKRLAAPLDRRSISPAPSTGRDRTVSTGSESAPVSRRASARNTSRRSTLRPSQQAGESSFLASVALPPPKSSHDPFDLHDMGVAGQWQDDVFSAAYPELQQLDWQAQPASDWMYMNAPLSETTWNLQTDDYFESPEQIEQMLGFCRSYIHWLQPGVTTEAASAIVGRIWDQVGSPMLLAACCLVAVGHLDAVQPGRPAGNYEFYKAKILRDISNSVQSSETATSDETIAALACLMSYEMSKGSSEALTHLQGLQSTLKLKGGMEEIDLNGLAMSIEVLDMLHAILYEESPAFATAITTYASDCQVQGTPLDAEGFGRLATRMTAEQELLWHDGHNEHSLALAQIPALLSKACACLNASDMAPKLTQDAPVNGNSSQDFLVALQAYGSSSCRGDPASDTIHLGRCCYFAMSIVHNLIANGVPHRHGSNQAKVYQLCDALRRVKNSTWVDVTYLRLFVLLTGAVATTDQSQKSFFTAELVRTAYQSGPKEWQHTRAFVLFFLEMKTNLERPERLSAMPVGMTIPILAQRTHSAPQLSLVVNKI